MTSSLALNQHSNLIARLSNAALNDIENIDPSAHGFCRACDGRSADGVVEKSAATLMGTFENLKRHVFVGTNTPATVWDKTADNVVGLKEISKAVKGLAETRVTAFYDPLLKEGGVRRLVFDWRRDVGTVETTEIVGVDAKSAHFVGGAAANNNNTSDEVESGVADSGVRRVLPEEKIFVFVCAHTKRDARCGYCGPAIVDLMQQELKAKKADDLIFVYPCSHVGGHVYAGNVLVYGRNGGIVYGNFCPSDVECLVDHLITKGASVEPPAVFKEKVRGYLGDGPQTTEGTA